MSLSLISSGEPDCLAATGGGSACDLIWGWTNTAWLAEAAEIAVKPLRIILIIVICLLARRLLNRAISRMATATAEGRSPGLLRPFKEKAAEPAVPSSTIGERRRQRARALGSVMRSLVTGIVFTIMIMMVLGEFNVNLAPLLASAGIAGLAVGFGAQALVKDVISGMFMLMEDQYGVGDRVDLGEASGTVEAVGLRVTTVRDVSGSLWYVRNGEIIRVGNMSQGWAMVLVDVPVGPDENVEDAKRIITETLAAIAGENEWAESLLATPELLGVQEVSAYGITLRVSAKSTTDGQWALGRELRGRTSEALRAAGISAGIPQAMVQNRPGGSTSVI